MLPEEAPRDWSLWWRFVLATNLGWFPGIGLGVLLARMTGLERELAGAVLAAGVAALFVGLAQGRVLARLEVPPVPWLVATLGGWPVGVGLAELLLPQFPEPQRTAMVAFVAGGVVGIPQGLVLLRAGLEARTWAAVSAVGWGILFPGMLTGLWLARLVDAEWRRTH